MIAHRRYLRAQPIIMVALMVAALVSSCAEPAEPASCRQGGSTAQVETGLPDTLNVGVANNIAMAAPLTELSSVGIADPNLKTASTPEELRTNFVTGRYDIAAMPINIAANLCSRGVDLALLGSVSGNIIYLMGPPESTLDDVRGGAVHIPFKNDIPDLMTRRILDNASITYDGENADTTLEYHPTPLDIATGLSTGEMTYAVLPEHLATVVAQASPNTVKALSLQELWTRQTGTSTLPFAGFVIRGELVDRYPELVSRLQESLASAPDDVLADPQTGSAKIADVVPVPAEITAEVLPGMKPKYTPAADARDDIDFLYRSLYEHEPESVGSALPGDGFYLGA